MNPVRVSALSKTRTFRRANFGVAICLAWTGCTPSVLADRQLAEENSWIYNDLAAATAKARETDKPLMVVLRCPP